MQSMKWPLLILASCGLTSIAIAQPPSSGTAEASDTAAPACELHIWPSAGLESVTEGWLLNQTRNQALRGKAGDATELAEALEPRAQLDAIGTLDLPGAFHLGRARLIVHKDPLPAGPAGTSKIRQAASTNPCYVEFIIRRLVYARNGFAGGALQGFFTIRAFDAQGALSRSFTSMADAPLAIFPWKGPQDAESGRNELRNALRADILTFASYAQKAPPKRQ